MANGRNNNTIPLMGLLNQIERNEVKSTNQVGELMQSFESLAKQTDSVEGYENAKTNIQNLPDLNPFVKAKKDILLKTLDNEIKSQKTYDSLQTEVNNLTSQIKANPTENFNSLLADMTMTIASKKNMISDEENVQLKTLLEGLDSYSNIRQIENEADQLANTVNAEGENNPSKANMSLQQKNQLSGLLTEAKRTGNLSKPQGLISNAISGEAEARADAIEALGKSDQYGGASESIYYTGINKQRDLAGTLTNVARVMSQDKDNPYTITMRTEGYGEGKKITDPNHYINQADKAADIIHGFIFGGDLEDDFLGSLGNKWKDPSSKKDKNDRWKPQYVEKMIEFVQKEEKESGWGNKDFSNADSRKLRGFASAYGFDMTDKFGSEMRTNVTNLWAKAVDYYNYNQDVNSLLDIRRQTDSQATEGLQFESQFNIMD